MLSSCLKYKKKKGIKNPKFVETTTKKPPK